MARQADKRAHLDLQVNILAEQEMTMMLRMQQRLCDHFGVEVDTVRKEAKQLMEKRCS
jgi:predicted nucleotidyltransferase